MAPIWSNYFASSRKIMFVLDAANLAQLGNATLLLMELLSHPGSQYSQVSFFTSLEDQANT